MDKLEMFVKIVNVNSLYINVSGKWPVVDSHLKKVKICK